MKIVVIGGTGLIGSKTVAILRQGGHEVVGASPKGGGVGILRDLGPQPSRGRGRGGRSAPCRAIHSRDRSGMKAPRSSAASTAACLARRPSAISRVCGLLPLPPLPALDEQ
jgi:uncharacterized protein YbjT (DUF2867 family)